MRSGLELAATEINGVVHHTLLTADRRCIGVTAVAGARAASGSGPDRRRSGPSFG